MKNGSRLFAPRDISFGDGQWVATGSMFNGVDNTVTVVSTDGIKWVQGLRSGTGASVFAGQIHYAEGNWVLTDFAFAKHYVSTTGLGNSWNGYAQTSPGGLSGVTYGAGRWVMVGYRGAVMSAIHPNSKPWTLHVVDLFPDLSDVAFGNGLFVGVGALGTIVTTSDFASLGQPFVPTSSKLNSVSFGNGRWVAVGKGGVIVTSSNGATWTLAAGTGSEDLNGVSYGDGQWLAVGASGALYSSADGQVWISLDSPTSSSIAAIHYADGKWVMLASGSSYVGTVPAPDMPPVISSPGSASATVGQVFNYTITANNSPASYGASGLPSGLSINTATGLISGTTVVAGTFTVTLYASNDGGTDTQTLVLTVNTAIVSPSFNQHPANATGTSGSTVTFTATAGGTPAPTLIWQRSVNGGSTWGNLTDGNGFSGTTTSALQLSGVTTAITGHKFRLSASNAAGNAYSQPATLTVNSMVISASAGANGSISPSGSINKDAGASQSFTATPKTGYQVDQWLVNGGAVQTGGTTYSLNNIQANQTVAVTFKAVTISYTVTATSGANGSISPAGAVSKIAGSSQTFTATPQTGYAVDQWFLNGTPVLSTAASYTLDNIQASQTVSVSFKTVSSRLITVAGQSVQSVKTTGYRIAIDSIAGKAYRLEWSQDLNTWNVLGTFTGNGAVLEQLDVSAKSAPQRFYRVVEN